MHFAHVLHTLVISSCEINGKSCTYMNMSIHLKKKYVYIYIHIYIYIYICV